MIGRLLDLVSQAFALVRRFFGFLDEQKAAGRREALHEREQRILESIRDVQRRIEEADKAHRADPTDDAFDKDFWRD